MGIGELKCGHEEMVEGVCMKWSDQCIPLPPYSISPCPKGFVCCKAGKYDAKILVHTILLFVSISFV